MAQNTTHTLLPIAIALGFVFTPGFVQAKDSLFFVSSFVSGKEANIYTFQLNSENGTLKQVATTPGAENPFFLALSPDKKFLYSIHAKSFGGKDAEEVAAFAVLDGGKLKLINRQSSRGTASCYLDVDKTGKTVVVANYSSGSVASLPVKDGALVEAASFYQHSGSSVNPARQKEPHAHCIVVSPDNQYVFAADLGLDQILSYKIDTKIGKISPHNPPFTKTPPGAGPRHLTFHPNGKRMYVINELLNSVTMFDYDSNKGSLEEKQTIPTLPGDFKGVSHCSDLKITPDGKFLYGTNRGHDSIAAYSIESDGKLKLLGIEPSLGKGPQNLAITKDGKFLICANMPGKNIVVFRIDEKTGLLKAVGEPTSIPSPSCIMLLE